MPGRGRWLYQSGSRRVLCSVEGCSARFLRQSELRSHMLIEHECGNCGHIFLNLQLHLPCFVERQIQQGGAIEEGPFILVSTAHANRILVYRNSELNEGLTDLTTYFNRQQAAATALMTSLLQQRRGVIIEITTNVQLERDDVSKDVFLRSPSMTLLHPNLIPNVYHSALLQQQSVLELFTELGSGWRVKKFIYFEISFATYNPTRGGGFIPTPKELEGKGLLNIENKDNYCFLYCVYAHLFPINGRLRDKVNPKKYMDMMVHPNYKLELGELSFPVAIQDFNKFEQVNNLSINIYSYNLIREDDVVVFPIVLTRQRGISRERHINLLLLEEDNKFHYILITNLSAFMGNADYRYDLCRFCLNKFVISTSAISNGSRLSSETDKRTLNEHESICRTVNGPRILFPEEGCIEFNDLKQTFAVPYICFADFEAFLTQIDMKGTDLHDPSSYAYVICSEEKVEKIYLYDEENPVLDLIEKLLLEADEYLKRINEFQPLQMTAGDLEDHNNSIECNFCKQKYTDKNKKVKHHAHVDCIYLGESYKAGEYICTLCNNCNLQIKFKKELYCLFHNGQRYDMKMLIGALTTKYKGRVDILAKTKKQFISITIDKKLRITDSIQHLRGGLADLVDSLAKVSLDKFRVTRSVFSDFNHILHKLVRKQPFPYKHCTGPEVWKETSLPPREAFYNDLKNEAISDQDYSQAQEIWKDMGCKTFRDYCRIYLTLDVTLLADVYLDYRRSCMKELIIDPTYSITSSGYSFQAFLYLSEVRIDYIKDMDIYLMLKRGLKGGVTQAATRFVKTNLPEVEGYDDTKPKSEIMFTDCNAMYPSAMMKPMPISGFRMLEDWELESFDIMNIDDSLGKGYIIECDVEYPDALHTAHAMFPMMPEKYSVGMMELSDYQLNLLFEMKQGNSYAAEKLLLTLFDKKNYICYHKLLRFYCSKGIVIKKYHRVIEFNETAYMADYVEKISKLRKNASSEILGLYYKIILNSIYGYCLRCKANDIICELCFDGETCEQYLARHNYHSNLIISEDLSVFQFKPNTVNFTQPYATGFCITELARLELYSFYYDVLSPHFNNRLSICMMDTDSIMVNIELKDEKSLTDELEEIKEHFDFSNLSNNSPHFRLKSNVNASIPGKWKLEKNGRRIREACALKVKQYSYLLDDLGEVTKGKGVPRPVLKRLQHQQYKDILKGGPVIRSSAKHIVSKKLQLYTVEVNKLSLHAFTASRYILSDGINTLPFGHKDIRNSPFSYFDRI